MPFVTIVQGKRDIEKKRKLVESITAAFVDTYHAERSSIHIVFQEVTSDQWAAGGQLLADG